MKISVHRHDHFALGRLDPGGHRRGLPEVQPEADHAQRRLAGREGSEPGEGAVARAVVDADHLVRATEPPQDAEQLGEQGLDVRFLVVEGDDKGELWLHPRGGITRAVPHRQPSVTFAGFGRAPVFGRGLEAFSCSHRCAPLRQSVPDLDIPEPVTEG